MSQHRTIEEQWSEFAAHVMPPFAPPEQWREMRRAFYAGFHACLCSVGDVEQLSDDEGVLRLDAWMAEGKRFCDDMLAGDA